MTFPLHDLTGVIKTKEREAELMRYMGVNNLDFNIAKRHAPKDKGKPAFGLIKEGVFKAYPKGSSPFKTAVQERLIPDPEKTKAKEIATHANVKGEQSKEAEGPKAQTGNLESLVRLLSQSRADLMRSATDGHAIFESAERMTKEANDWIIERICDLELLYETLDFLENKMKVAEKTIASSQENMRNARKILAQLTATDYKKTTPQTDSNTGDSNLAADRETYTRLSMPRREPQATTIHRPPSVAAYAPLQQPRHVRLSRRRSLSRTRIY
ncbi:hypothetical protein OESDEN_08332 [Oesophagostomum dentatum]|uniref:Uncharacterized protein n=1 Tax=Oesophagostomum dentatum TaxID=61180 RepID=A0A0B1T8T4_OESDE|nr:hypothetical protein OESDEN_08332 [Oesophagostomum dentatum]